MPTTSKSSCNYCGNPKRDKLTDHCTEGSCYWYCRWIVDMNDFESVKNRKHIEVEIKDMSW